MVGKMVRGMPMKSTTLTVSTFYGINKVLIL